MGPHVVNYNAVFYQLISHDITCVENPFDLFTLSTALAPGNIHTQLVDLPSHALVHQDAAICHYCLPISVVELRTMRPREGH